MCNPQDDIGYIDDFIDPLKESLKEVLDLVNRLYNENKDHTLFKVTNSNVLSMKLMILKNLQMII